MMVALNEVTEIITDGTHYTPVDLGEGVPFLTVKDMTPTGLDFITSSKISADDFRAADSGNSAPKFGDVLFSKDGTVGKVHVVSEEKQFAVLSSIAIIRPKSDLLDSRYLAWALRSPKLLSAAEQRKTGSAVRRIILADLKILEIPLPPLSEQRRIASILDQADNLRVLRRNSLEVLKTIAVSYYESVELHSYDWTEVALSDVVAPGDRINYGVVQPGEEDRNGTPLIRVGDLRNGVVDRSKLRRIASEVESGYSRSRISGNEVLVSCVGSIGEVAIIGPQDVGSNVARAVARVPVRADVERSYVAAVLRSDRVQSYFHSELRTVSQPTLNIKQLALTRISLPPREIQDKFRRVSASLETLVKSSRLHLAHLDELFASLQYRAFRGEL